MQNRWLKTMLVVFCATAMVAGQQPAFSPQNNDDCYKKYPVGLPAVQVFQRYEHLPRNRQEDVAVVLYRPKNEYGCCALTNKPDQSGIVPVKFELESSPGFIVRFKTGAHYQLQKPGTPLEMSGAKIVLLKIRPHHGTPLGDYVLHGKLTYQAIQNNHLQPLQDLEVTILVKVTAENAKVTEIDWPFGTHFKRDLMNVISLPVELPAYLLLLIGCSVKNCDL